MAFDPDAYLASKPTFNPDSYLGGSQPTGKTESAARGAFQGLSAGFGDELSAGLSALVPALDPEAAKGETIGDRYRNARTFYRGLNANAEQSNPKTYLTGQFVGGAAPTLVGPVATGTKALLGAAGQGAAAGAGYSEANDARGLARDSALGAALGTAGYGAGKVAGQGLSWVGGKAREAANLARGRAGVQASQEVAEGIASARGQLGGETQKGSRYVENLMRLEESMTPEQRALYSQLQASGVIPGLQQSVAQGTLESLPSQAATIAAKRAALEAAVETAPEVAAQRTAQLLKPQVKADAKTFLKAYAEPLAWGAGGLALGNALGLSPDATSGLGVVAGAIGGRTRAGKALWTRLNRPAHQLALAEGIQNKTEQINPMVQAMLRRAAPAAVAAALATKDNGP